MFVSVGDIFLVNIFEIRFEIKTITVLEDYGHGYRYVQESDRGAYEYNTIISGLYEDTHFETLCAF